MHRTRRFAQTGLFVVALTGCGTINIGIAPDTTEYDAPTDAALKIRATVGYFIPNQYRYGVVRTANGVASYYPYRDIEAGYRKMLASVFEGVVRLDSPTDPDAIAAAGVRYVIAPEMLTSLTAPNALTLTPTGFTVELTSNIRCPVTNVLVANPQVVGESDADIAESFYDESAAGRRAMSDAIRKMQKALRSSKLGSDAQGGLCGRGEQASRAD